MQEPIEVRYHTFVSEAVRNSAQFGNSRQRADNRHQLDGTPDALDVTLGSEQVARLDTASRIRLRTHHEQITGPLRGSRAASVNGWMRQGVPGA
jgi:hypothetical protein